MQRRNKGRYVFICVMSHGSMKRSGCESPLSPNSRHPFLRNLLPYSSSYDVLLVAFCLCFLAQYVSLTRSQLFPRSKPEERVGSRSMNCPARIEPCVVNRIRNATGATFGGQAR